MAAGRSTEIAWSGRARSVAAGAPPAPESARAPTSPLFVACAMTDGHREPDRQASQPNTAPSTISAGRRTGSRCMIAKSPVDTAMAVRAGCRVRSAVRIQPRNAASSQNGATVAARSASASRVSRGASKMRDTSKVRRTRSGSASDQSAESGTATPNAARLTPTASQACAGVGRRARRSAAPGRRFEPVAATTAGRSSAHSSLQASPSTGFAA
jgi:hypothetical protein